MFNPATITNGLDSATFALLIELSTERKKPPERNHQMSYLEEISPVLDCMPVGLDAAAQVGSELTNAGKIEPRCRVTRSTLAFRAAELVELPQLELIEAFAYSASICRQLNREEIVVENLQDIGTENAHLAVTDVHSLLQAAIHKAFRSLGRGEPRIALERRSFGFDLRVYTEVPA